jgi:hypothetical protein
MLPIQRAAKAIDELRRADERALIHILQAESVVPANHRGLPGLNVQRTEHGTHFITGTDVLDYVLFAATGEHIRNADDIKDAPQVCADFDPCQSWLDVAGAIDYCARQPNPDTAMRLIAEANLRMDERGWTVEFLRACPDIWEAPATSVLQAAAHYVTPSKQFSATQSALVLFHDGIHFEFREEGGLIHCAFLQAVDGQEPTPVASGSISATASSTKVAEFVRDQAEQLAKAHQGVPGAQRYRAVPILAYVPLTDSEEHDVARVIDQLRADTDARVFVAEDFETGVATETPDDDLSAMIQTACPRSEGC